MPAPLYHTLVKKNFLIMRCFELRLLFLVSSFYEVTSSTGLEKVEKSKLLATILPHPCTIQLPKPTESSEIMYLPCVQ